MRSKKRGIFRIEQISEMPDGRKRCLASGYSRQLGFASPCELQGFMDVVEGDLVQVEYVVQRRGHQVYLQVCTLLEVRGRDGYRWSSGRRGSSGSRGR